MVNIQDVADDVLSEIFYQLELTDLLNISETNKQFNTILKQDKLINKKLEERLEVLDNRGLFQTDIDSLKTLFPEINIKKKKNNIIYSHQRFQKCKIKIYDFPHKILYHKYSDDTFLILILCNEILYCFGSLYGDKFFNYHKVNNIKKIYYIYTEELPKPTFKINFNLFSIYKNDEISYFNIVNKDGKKFKQINYLTKDVFVVKSIHGTDHYIHTNKGLFNVFYKSTYDNSILFFERNYIKHPNYNKFSSDLIQFFTSSNLDLNVVQSCVDLFNTMI
jgi:hypothetical protein